MGWFNSNHECNEITRNHIIIQEPTGMRATRAWNLMSLSESTSRSDSLPKDSTHT